MAMRDDARDKRIAAAYAAGAPVIEIKQAHHIGFVALKEILARHGVPLRAPRRAKSRGDYV